MKNIQKTVTPTQEFQEKFYDKFLHAVQQLQKPEHCGTANQVSNRLLQWVLENIA